MTKDQRKLLREKIVAALDDMTSEASNRESAVTIGAHAICRRLLYAGGSQWVGCDRDWDSTENGWAWVVDDEYRLTTPDLFGFDGHNMIERQTGYYLQDEYDEQTTPEHDGRNEIDRVPNRLLIEIAKGLVEAQKEAQSAAQKEESEATELLEKLGVPVAE